VFIIINCEAMIPHLVISLTPRSPSFALPDPSLLLPVCNTPPLNSLLRLCHRPAPADYRLPSVHRHPPLCLLSLEVHTGSDGVRITFPYFWPSLYSPPLFRHRPLSQPQLDILSPASTLTDCHHHHNIPPLLLIG